MFNKALIVLLIFIAFNSEAQLINFSKKQNINSSDINQNVTYINNILNNFTYSLNWNNKTTGELINKNDYDNLFTSLNNLDSSNIFDTNNLNSNINSEELNLGFENLELQAKNIVPQSCLEIITRDPTKINQDGLYYIDTDGFDGPEQPYQVYCDMTTDGGGWTNIASNMGTYTNQLSGDVSAIGISTSSNGVNFVNGVLKSITGAGSCTESSSSTKYLNIPQNVMNRFNATEVKLDAKSYAGNTSSTCGGILFHVDYDGSTLKQHNSFNLGNLSRCGTPPNGYNQFTDSSYLHFSFVPNTTNVARLTQICTNTGISKVQIRSIMIR